MNAELDYVKYISAGIAALSFLWGMIQYFDKRKSDKKSLELKNKVTEYEVMEKAYKNRADLVVFYIETKLGSLLTYGCGASSWFEVPRLTQEDFESAFIEWVQAIKKTIPFPIKMSFMANPKYERLKRFIASADSNNGANHLLCFMLLRNEGSYAATEISIDFQDIGVATEIIEPEASIDSMTIDAIGPGEAVLIHLSHINPESGDRYGYELMPRESLIYFDKFLGKKQTIKVRPPYETPKIVDKGLLIRG